MNPPQVSEDSSGVKVESSTDIADLDQDDLYNKKKNFKGKRKFLPKHSEDSKSHNDKFMEKIEQLSGPTFDLPPVCMEEKKFSGRNRLYIANIGNEITEEDIEDLFKPFGETRETFINKDKNFAFIKMDYQSNAVKAKRELDGVVLKNRNLRVRLAPNIATVKVKNLSPLVTNELLHYAFRVFGEIERAIVSVDERGKPTGEAIIDFVRKGSALYAVHKCKEGCFFLTGSLRPCIVEHFESSMDTDGYPEKNIPKRNGELFVKEREVGPNFATPGSFKFEYGSRWKKLYELYSEKEQTLKRQFEMEKEKLEAQMEYAKYEHETELLRQQLRFREMGRERQKREWEMKEKQMEEQRIKIEENIRMQEEELESCLRAQEEKMLARHEENKLFLQNHLSLIEPKEQFFNQPNIKIRNDSFPYNEMGPNNSGYWVNDNPNRQIGYQFKRRRYF